MRKSSTTVVQQMCVVLAAFIVACIASYQPARAASAAENFKQVSFLMRGSAAAGSAPSTQISYFDHVNTSSSAESLVISPFMGLQFVQGDIASGTAPIFKRDDNSQVCPFSWGLNRSWAADGSLDMASFVVRCPGTVAGATAISTVSYTSGTGLVTLTFASSPGVTAGQTINISGATGTGAVNINGTFIAGSGTSGTTVTYTIQNGYTISGITGALLDTVLKVDIYSGGFAPAASSRTLAEIACNTSCTGGANPDIQVLATSALSNLSGQYNASFYDATQNGKCFVWIDGAAGKGWMCDGDFRPAGGGSIQGMLRVRWYEFSTTDNSGNLGGIRFEPRVWLPYYDKATTKQAFAFSSLAMCYGTVSSSCSGGTTVNWQWPYTSSTFDWTSSVTYSAPSSNYYSGAIGDAGNRGIVPVILSTTGGATLPGGLNTGVLYTAQGIGASSGLQANTNIQLSSYSYGAFAITATSNCSIVGDCVITPTLAVWPGGSILGATGKATYQYIQGGGSTASDTTLRVQRDITYWHKTRTIPPLNLALVGQVTDLANPSTGQSAWYGASGVSQWDPVTSGLLGLGEGATGDIADLGTLNEYQAQAYYWQSAKDELEIRIEALAAANFNNAWRDSTNFAIVNTGNPGTTYTGFGANVATTFQWAPQTGFNFSPGANPPTTAGATGWAGTSGNAHQPATWYYGYLFTGEPEMLDIGMELAEGSMTVLGGSFSRNPNWPSQYYNISAYSPQERGASWTIRELGTAAGVAPDVDPEGIAYKQYFTDSINNTLAYLNVNIANASTWTAGSGFHVYYNHSVPILTTSAPFEHGYGVISVELATAINDNNANGLAYIANESKWDQYETSNFNDYVRYGYYQTQGTSAAFTQPATAPITSDTQWGTLYQASIGWSSTGYLPTSAAHFEVSGNTSIGYPVTDGDKFIFTGVIGTGNIPGGFTAGGVYYVCGSTITGTDPAYLDFSTIKGAGCAAGIIVPTNSQSQISEAAVFLPVAPTSTGLLTCAGSGCTPAIVLGDAYWGAALGISGFSQTISDAITRLTAGGIFNSSCLTYVKYCMQGSYLLPANENFDVPANDNWGKVRNAWVHP